MNPLNKDVFYTFLIRQPTLILTFLYMVIITRLLGPEGNGVYTFILANINLGILLLGLGQKKALTFFSANEEVAFERLLGLAALSLMTAILIFSGVYVLAMIFNLSWLSFLLPNNYQSSFYALYACVLFSCLYLTVALDSFFRGKTQFKAFNIFSLISNALSVCIASIALAFVIYFPEKSLSIRLILSMILSIHLLNICIYLFVFVRVFRQVLHFRFPRKREIRRYWHYAQKAYAINLTSFFNKRADVWFVEFFRGLSALGIYALAANISNFLMLIVGPIFQVLMPYFTKMRQSESHESFLLYCRIMTAAMILITAFAALVAGVVVPFVFGKAFESAVLPMRILCIGIIFSSLRNLFAVYNSAYDLLHRNLYAHLAALVITIVLDFLLIPKYGIIGASIASVCAYATGFFFMSWAFLSKIKRPLSAAFFLKKTDIHYIWNELNQLKK